MTVGAPAWPPFAFAGMSPTTTSPSPYGTSSASPPIRLTKSRTHSAARRTSSACAGSALTLGIAMNSRNSSSQEASTGGEFSCRRRLEPGRDDRRAAPGRDDRGTASLDLLAEQRRDQD